MKSQILVEENPSSIRIYEKPEVKDVYPWIIIVGMFFISMIGLFTLGNQNLRYGALFIIIVIVLPFFINRFILQKGWVGGESFKLQRLANNIIVYKNKKFDIDKVDFEFIQRKMRYGYVFLLYMIIGDDEIKLRSDYGQRNENSVTYNLMLSMENHLNLTVNRIEEKKRNVPKKILN